MKIVIGITIIVLVALVGSRWTFTRARLPLGAQRVYLTGSEFMLVGLCLGELLLGLLDRPTVSGLSPLLDLALGWLGLLFGAQLEYRQITRFPGQYITVTLALGGATLLACLPMGLLLGQALGPEQWPWLGALVLAAAAVPTAPAALALVQQELRARQGGAMEVLRFVAGLDALVGLVVFGLVFTFPHTHSPLGPAQLITVQYLLICLGLGGLMGLVLHLLTRLGCTQAELQLFTVGVVALTAGVAAFLKLSPLTVTLVSGVVIANMRGERARILLVLLTLEKPLYLVLLIFAGALVRPVPDLATVLLLALAYTGLRSAGKIAGGFACSRLLRPAGLRLPSSLGFGLTSQGGMAVAMVVSFHRGFFDHPHLDGMASAVLVIALVSILANELLSPSFARAALGKEA